MNKKHKTISSAPDNTPELSIVRFVNGQQIDAQSLSRYTVINPVISNMIHKVDSRVKRSISTKDTGYY